MVWRCGIQATQHRLGLDIKFLCMHLTLFVVSAIRPVLYSLELCINVCLRSFFIFFLCVSENIINFLGRLFIKMLVSLFFCVHIIMFLLLLLTWFRSYGFVNSLASTLHLSVFYCCDFIHSHLHAHSSIHCILFFSCRWRKVLIVCSCFWQHTRHTTAMTTTTTSTTCPTYYAKVAKTKKKKKKENTGYSINVRQQVLFFASYYHRISCALHTCAHAFVHWACVYDASWSFTVNKHISNTLR